MQVNDERIKEILNDNGIDDFKIINVKDAVVVEDWVRLHCMFGCSSYGNCGTCPPALPSVAECREMVMSYNKAIIMHFPVPYVNDEQYADDRKIYEKKIFAAERALFKEGYYKAILLTPDDCHLCGKCICGSDRSKCVNPDDARPCMEGLGISVYDTVMNVGYDVHVLKEYGELTNRFAMILLD